MANYINTITTKGANMTLTSRESEVMELVCEGLTNDEIAKRLIITVHTVKSHIESIIYKLRAKNRTSAVYIFCQNKYKNKQN